MSTLICTQEEGKRFWFQVRMFVCNRARSVDRTMYNPIGVGRITGATKREREGQ